MSVWKNNDPEITSKTKFAKYHALRIVKAIKANGTYKKLQDKYFDFDVYGPAV